MDDIPAGNPPPAPPPDAVLPPLIGDATDQRYAWAWAPATFGLLTLAMFIDVLFTSSRTISSAQTDLALQFLSWREFGFTQLRQGNLALWNPYAYGGMPYLAGFQSALLYPPNWLHLILPLTTAFTWVVALHVFLAGYFTYLWCRGRGVGIGGAILAGMMFMFSGPYFLHLYAGHPPHLAVMVWTPLMLLALDRISETGKFHWLLLGIVAAAMQILAGHPQYVYYTGIVLSCYAALLIIKSEHRWALAGGFVGMYLGAVLVTAIQLLPGIESVSESVRSGGTGYKFAASFSLPPANLITLLAPNFFGTAVMHEPPAAGALYWGAGYLWEMSLFVSITGLLLAGIGAAMTRRWKAAIPLVMIGVTLILALGRHTPLYQPMFKFLPGYSSFRGTVKFAYITVLFVAMLAGIGFDGVLGRRRQPLGLLLGLMLGALILLVAGALIWNSAAGGADGAWAHFVQYTRDVAHDAGELFLPMSESDVPAAGRRAAVLLCAAAVTILIVAAALWGARLHRLAPYALLLLAGAELFIVARATRATMSLSETPQLPAEWKQTILALPSDQRVLIVPTEFANLGMSMGFRNVQGYDPGVLKRFAELIFATQNINPAEASQYFSFRQANISAFRMLRCSYVFVDPAVPPLAIPEPLPVALLVTDLFQPATRLDVLRYICGESFNPSRTAVLEAPLDAPIQRTEEPAGTVSAAYLSTDSLEITADVTHPALLVVTNNYSKGWRVVPIKGGQLEYRIVPVNYTQIGIPLEKGSHRFILEYSPVSFRIGRWISLGALLMLGGTSFWLMPRRRWFR